jgi:hypothetical protein
MPFAMNLQESATWSQQVPKTQLPELPLQYIEVALVFKE